MNAASILDLVRSSRKLAATTREVYTRAIGHFIAHAGTDPRAWTPLVVDAWAQDQLRAGVEPGTVNDRLTALRFAARRYRDVLNGEDFTRGVESFRVLEAKHPGTALTEAQLRRLVATTAPAHMTAIDLRDRALILVALHGALRAREVCRLQIADVDLRGRTVRYQAKGERLAQVALEGDGLRTLAAWLAWLRRGGITTGPVFRGMFGDVLGRWHLRDTPLTQQAFAKMLARRGKRAGIERLHPHMLRHTHISLARAAGVADWKIVATAGWAGGNEGRNAARMLARYTHNLTGESSSASLPSVIGTASRKVPTP